MPHVTSFVERITRWIGSGSSVVLHTIAFGCTFALGAMGVASWEKILLILTTAVSLEAIYLAIFIQMTVNQNTESLREVEEDVDEIQKDVDEIQEDIDAIEHDVDEIQEDEEEEIARDAKQEEMLENISTHLQKLLGDIEKMKKG